MSVWDDPVVEQGSPRFAVKDGLMWAAFHPSDAVEMQELIKARIRRQSHRENMDLKVFAEVATLARMGFELAERQELSGLSKTDLDVLTNLPFEPRVRALKEAILHAESESFPLREMPSVDPVLGEQLSREMHEIIDG